MKKIIATFAILLVALVARADSLFSNCLGWGDFSQIEQYQLYPVNPICQSTCQSTCSSLFSTIGNGGVELNKDQIYNCIMACQNGVKYSGIKRAVENDQCAQPVSMNSPCTNYIGADAQAAADYPGTNYIRTEHSFSCNSGDLSSCFSAKRLVATITSGSNPGSMFPDGTIYRCGINYTQLFPVPYSSNPNAAAAYPPTTGSCNKPGVNLSPGTWDSIWSAQKTVPTFTNMYIRNGDQLNLSWQGQYIYNGSIVNGSFQGTLAMDDLNLYLYTPQQAFTESVASPSSLTLLNSTGTNPVIGLNPSKQYSLMNKDHIIWSNGSLGTQYNIQYSGVVSGNEFFSYFTPLSLMHYYPMQLVNQGAVRNDPSSKFYAMGGLFVNVERLGCPESDGSSVQFAMVSSNDILPTGKTVWSDLGFKYGTTVNLDPGIMAANVQANYPNSNNFTGSMFLRIRPLVYDVTSENASYQTDYDVKSMMPVCPLFTSGTALVNCLQTVSALKQSLPNETMQNFPAVGSYTVQIKEIAAQNQLIDSFFSCAVSNFRGLFFGVSDSGVTSNCPGLTQGGQASTTGLVQDVFNGLVSNPEVSLIIKAVLLLYVTWTGLSYMIGLSPMTVQDGLARLLKISIIAALLSPTAWEFFNTYLFNLLIDGGFYLINLLVGQSDLAIAYGDSGAVTAVFQIFDPIVTLLLTPMVWARIVAAMFDSASGFLTAIFAMIAIVIYASTILRIVMMYLVCIISLAIMLMLTPLFILFLLFNYTKEYFDTWIGQLINFTLQPVAIFVGVAFLSDIIYNLFLVTFSFPVCQACYFSIGIPFIPLIEPICLMPGYKSVESLASGGLTTSISVAAAFGLLVAAHAFNKITSLMSDVVNRISGFYIGLQLAQAAESASSAAMTGLKMRFGVAYVASGSALRREYNNIIQNEQKESKQRSDMADNNKKALNDYADAMKKFESARSGSSASKAKSVNNALQRLKRLRVPDRNANLLNGDAGSSLALRLLKELKGIVERADLTGVNIDPAMLDNLNRTIRTIRMEEFGLIDQELDRLSTNAAANKEAIDKLTALRKLMVDQLGDHSVADPLNRDKVSAQRSGAAFLENQFALEQIARKRKLAAEALNRSAQLNREYDEMLEGVADEETRIIIRRYVVLRRTLRAAQIAYDNAKNFNLADQADSARIAAIRDELKAMESGSEVIRIIGERESLVFGRFDELKNRKSTKIDDTLRFHAEVYDKVAEKNARLQTALARINAAASTGRAEDLARSEDRNQLLALGERLNRIERDELPEISRITSFRARADEAPSPASFTADTTNMMVHTSEALSYGAPQIIKQLDELSQKIDDDSRDFGFSNNTASSARWHMNKSGVFDDETMHELDRYHNKVRENTDEKISELKEQDEMLIKALSHFSYDQIEDALTRGNGFEAVAEQMMTHAPAGWDGPAFDEAQEMRKIELNDRESDLSSELSRRFKIENKEGAYELAKNDQKIKTDRFEQMYQVELDLKESARKLRELEIEQEKITQHLASLASGETASLRVEGDWRSAKSSSAIESRLEQTNQKILEESKKMQDMALGAGLVSYYEFHQQNEDRNNAAFAAKVLQRASNATAYCYDTMTEFSPTTEYLKGVVGTTFGGIGKEYKKPSSYTPGSEKVDDLLTIPASMMTTEELVANKRLVEQRRTAQAPAPVAPNPHGAGRRGTTAP